jgi:predicted membrane-bound spermidine synthase
MTSNDGEDIALLRLLFGGRSVNQNILLASPAAGLIAAIVGIFAIVVAVSSVFVMRAELKAAEAIRQADVRDMAQIRVRLNTLEQYRDQHARRIEALEPQTEVDNGSR